MQRHGRLFVSLAALFAAGAGFAADITVNVGDSIENAIYAVGDSGTITLKAGTHYISNQAELLLDKPVTIVGETGNPADVIVKRPAADDSAKIGYRIFHLNHQDAKIKDLTAEGGRFFTDATVQYGCCVRVDDGTVEHCILEKSDTSGDTKYHIGGGFYMKLGRVTRSIIRDNKVHANNNNCKGSGAYLDGNCQVDNCLFVNNNGRHGTVSINNVNAKVYNCTLVGNVSLDYPGFRMYARGTVRNCICVDGTGAALPAHQLYDQYPECFSGCYTATLVGSGNVSGVLVFKNPANGDYRPMIASAVIDNHAAADVDWTASDLDLAGNPRVVNGIADIGCYEWSAASAGEEIGVTAVASAGLAPFAATLTAVVSGVTGASSYSWNFGDGTSETTQTPTVTHTFQTIGRYTVLLSVTDASSATHAAIPFVVRATGDEVEVDGTAIGLADALELVEDGGEIVLLADGSPHEIAEQVFVDRPITIRGETGDPADVVVKQTSTTVTTGPIRCFYVNHAQAIVKDLTMTKGRADNGAGVYITSEGGLVQNCVITENTSTAGSYGNGAGAYLAGGRMTQSTVSKNTGGGGGAVAGVYLSGNATMDRCLICDHTIAVNNQWGVVQLLGNSVMDSCVVTGNNYTKDAVCAGVYIYSGSPTVRNCTITGNTCAGSGVKTAGLFLRNDNGKTSLPRVVNCIMAGNSCPLGSDDWAKDAARTDDWAAQVFNNCFFGANAVGANPQSGDPAFTDATTGDFTLKASSRARNTGTTVFGLGEKDYAGNDRLQGDAPDMGAFEANAAELAIGFAANVREGFAGTTFNLSNQSTGITGTPAFTWTVTLGNQELTFTSENPSFTLNDVGWYRVELSVTCDSGTGSYGEDDFLHVAPYDVYVAADAEAAEYPYGTLATATADFATAWREIIAGATLHVSGIVTMATTLNIDKKVTVVGVDGRDTDGLSHQNGIVVTLNHPEAVLRGIRVQDGTQGVYMSTDGGLVEDCLIRNNVNRTAYVSGGGLYMVGTNAIVRRTIITENDIGSGGGGNNSGGGGVYISKGLLESCLVVKNTSGADGDGVYVVSPEARVVNCTIADNTQWNKRTGGGLFFKTGSLVNGAPEIVNCLLVNNHTDEGIVRNWYASATTDIGENLVAAFTTCAMDQVNSEAAWQLPAEAEVAIVPDPGFADDESYRLTRESVLRGMGTWQPWMSDATDVYGYFRCSAHKVAPGACEPEKVPGLWILIR